MENKKELIRLGSGKKINDTFFGSSFCITDALANAYEYNGKQYCNINIAVFPEHDQYGKNVKITLNDFKPNKNNDIKIILPENKTIINTKDDLPF
jgi:hypothetical protein